MLFEIALKIIFIKVNHVYYDNYMQDHIFKSSLKKLFIL